MTLMNQRFENHLKKNRLVSAGETLWVACSGGPDSVALFHLLNSLRKAWKLRLGILHFNHGLRGKSSDRDESFVRQLAKKNKTPFFCQKAKTSLKRPKKSVEEAAREARFDFFTYAAKKQEIRKIALAHHQNDQAETVLMRVLQGTGTRGLLGIRQQMRIGKTVFIRPLLPFTKKEIEGYLRQGKFAFRTDRTNDSFQFLRNRLRRTFLPWLEKEFNPNVIEAIARIPAIVAEEQDWFMELEEKHWRKIFKKREGQTVQLQRAGFLKSPKPIQFRILDRALKVLDKASGMNFEAWERLQSGLAKPRTRISLPRDLDFELTPSRIKLYKKPARPRRGLHSATQGARMPTLKQLKVTNDHG